MVSFHYYTVPLRIGSCFEFGNITPTPSWLLSARAVKCVLVGTSCDWPAHCFLSVLIGQRLSPIGSPMIKQRLEITAAGKNIADGLSVKNRDLQDFVCHYKLHPADLTRNY